MSKESSRALGAFAYVQRWIPGLAEIAQPLYAGITDKKYARLEWTQKMDEAFEQIKTSIANATALHIPDTSKPFVLVTDCSDYAAGAMLAQRDKKDKDALCPIAYYHHALTKAEQGYDTTEKELLAVIYALKKYKVYLCDKFQLITDTRALQYLNTLDAHDQRGRRGRWIDFLQQFDFETVHKTGKSPEMSIADYLSRVTASGQSSGTDTVAAVKGNLLGWPTTLFSIDELHSHQEQDPVIQTVLNTIKNDLLPEWRRSSPENRVTVDQRREANEVLKRKDRLFVDAQGILRLKFNGGKRSAKFPFGKNMKNRIVVPQKMRDVVLKLSHDSPMAGHMGIERTWQKMRDNFWWPNMKKEVNEYVNDCDRCGWNKHYTHSTRPPMQRTDIPEYPLDKIQVDFLGPFPAASTHEYRYVLQIQDVLSRFLMFIPCVDSRAETAAEMVIERWLCTLSSYPKIISSDRGTHFTAEVFETMCRLSGIKHKMGAPGHPQSQGQVERQQQLLNQVKALCNNDLELWPQAISRIQYSHNTSCNATTGMSPASLILGIKPVLPEDLVTEENITTQYQRSNDEDAASRIKENKDDDLRMAIERAKDNIIVNQERQIDRLDHDNNRQQYRVGKRVRYKLTSTDKRNLGGKKIAPRNSDEYIITKRSRLAQGWTYEIQPLPGSQQQTKHNNKKSFILS